MYLMVLVLHQSVKVITRWRVSQPLYLLPWSVHPRRPPLRENLFCRPAMRGKWAKPEWRDARVRPDEHSCFPSQKARGGMRRATW
jgi:hypothetical protein